MTNGKNTARMGWQCPDGRFTHMCPLYRSRRNQYTSSSAAVWLTDPNARPSSVPTREYASPIWRPNRARAAAA
eukprot:363116-Chlamydomonas_euryale.AAC.17